MEKKGEYRTGPETARLFMRAFEPDDAESFFRLVSDPEIIKFTGEPPAPSVEACRNGIENYPDFVKYGFGRWACILKSTGEIIGFSGLKYLEDWKVVDLGYRFIPEQWGKGIATESAYASMNFGFETLGLDEIHGFVDPEHPASIHVLKKMGMKKIADVVYDNLPTFQYAVGRDAYYEFIKK